MKFQLTIYGLIFLLGILIGGGVVWYIVNDFVNKAKIEAEQKFNDLLDQEKSKYSTKLLNLESSKEELELLVNLTQNEIDSLNFAISTRTKELNRLKKDYNDKVSKLRSRGGNLVPVSRLRRHY